jgi:hypothetical protein
MRSKTLFLALAATWAPLLTGSEAQAWIGDGFGYTVPGPNGYQQGFGRYGGLYTPTGGGDYQTGGSFRGVYHSAMGFGYPTSWNQDGRDNLFSPGNLINPSSGDARAGVRSGGAIWVSSLSCPGCRHSSGLSSPRMSSISGVFLGKSNRRSTNNTASSAVRILRGLESCFSHYSLRLFTV